MTARRQTPWRRLAEQLRAPYPGSSCRHCREELPLFVNDEVAGRPVDDLYPAVANHLDLCADCLQEYAALSRLVWQALFGEDAGE